LNDDGEKASDMSGMEDDKRMLVNEKG